MYLERLSSLQAKNLDHESCIAVVPLGAIEQHGHHLPLNTDTAIITALASALEKRMPEQLLVLPTLWSGHSTHHLAFPGTISVAQRHYQEIINEVCSSLIQMGIRKIFLLNGHGGNDVPARFAMREIKSRFSDIQNLHVTFASYWTLCRSTLTSVRESEMGGMGHACEMETSLMLHLHPELVDMSLAKRDGPNDSSPYLKGDMQQAPGIYAVREFHELSNSGTVGHPDLATAEKGERFFKGIVAELEEYLRDFASWKAKAV